MLDMLIWIPVAMPYFVAIVLMVGQGFDADFDPNAEPEITSTQLILMATSGALWLVVAIVQLTLLARNGQTLGKRWSSIRIVRDSGERASIWRLLFLRYLPIGLLSAIPFLGFLLALANVLLIFRSDQKCLHDHIAGTQVVRVA